MKPKPPASEAVAAEPPKLKRGVPAFAGTTGVGLSGYGLFDVGQFDTEVAARSSRIEQSGRSSPWQRVAIAPQIEQRFDLLHRETESARA